MNESFVVTWNGIEVGEITHLTNDMWYLDGTWNSYKNSASSNLEQELSNFNKSDFLKDPSKVAKVILTNKDDSTNKLYCLAMFLEDKNISLRMVVSPETLKLFFNIVL